MAEGESLIKKLKKSNNLLNKIVQCPICLDRIKVPFKQCATGHVLCSDCMKNLTGCPTCQEPFTTENPIIVKSLLEALPRLCRYSGDGCEQVVEPGEDHESFCGYRPVKCRKYGCPDTSPLRQLLKHYEEQHPTVLVIKSVEKQLCWSKLNHDTPRKGSNLVLLFNKLFWVNVENDPVKSQLNLSFQAMPNGEMENDYYVRVTLENNHYVYTYTMKASVLGSDNEEQENGGEPNKKNICCMRVSQRELHNFVNEQGSLNFKLFFFEANK